MIKKFDEKIKTYKITLKKNNIHLFNKNMGKAILAFVGILVIVIISFLTYFGFFNNVEIYVVETGGEYLVYESIKGNYSNASEIANKIYYSLLSEEKIETHKGFGIFYDNPKNVKKEDLRAEIGVILEQKDLDKIQDLEEKYSVRQLSAKQYITAEFPIKGTISYMLGTIKIRPKLEKFALEMGYDVNTPIMEIYNISEGKITYKKEIQNNMEGKEETPHR